MRIPLPRTPFRPSPLLLPLVIASVGPAQHADSAPAIAWQRTLPDALAVQEATGLPLLIVANMDGEVFNEQFATQVYRTPEFVELTRGYVCVVCSPDRHTERDYDTLGNRVECPRFPGCTCSEHILIEPELFTRFFNGTRNAPRHVGVSRDGKVLFDRFLDQSKQTAIDAIRQHRGTPKPGADVVPDAVAELFARRDAAARRTLELRFRSGDAKTRETLLTAAAKATNEPLDLLRLGLRSDDAKQFALAATALAATATAASLGDLDDALARAEEPSTRKALIDALARLGVRDPAVARFAMHAATTGTLADVAPPWRNEWRQPAFTALDRPGIEAELDRCEKALTKAPDDDEQRLRLAIAQAAFAETLFAAGAKGTEFWLEDCVRSATRVGAPAAAEARGLLAYAHWMQGDVDGAARLLADAPKDGDRRPDPWLASRALGADLQAIARRAFANPDEANKKDLRPEIARTLAILDLFAARRAAPDESAELAAAGLLEFAGLRREARASLERAAGALPGSQRIHERWRNRLFVDLGAEAMRQAYARHVAAATDKPTAEWFAGYAALIAGDRHTTDTRREPALAAYGEAIDRFTRAGSGNAEYVDTANHFIVLALGGRAHLRHAAGDDEGAVADIERAAALRAASLDDDDGLKRKPRAIAGRIARDLEQKGLSALAERLKPLLLN